MKLKLATWQFRKSAYVKIAFMFLISAIAISGIACEPPQKKVAKKEDPANDGGRTTNYQSGAGAVQNVRNAVNRTVTSHDLDQIRLFIETHSLSMNKMPTAKETYDTLKKEAAKIATQVDEKIITLHPAKKREDVWAYETAALTKGGLVLTASGVERMDAEVLKQKLNQ